MVAEQQHQLPSGFVCRQVGTAAGWKIRILKTLLLTAFRRQGAGNISANGVQARMIHDGGNSRRHAGLTTEPARRAKRAFVVRKAFGSNSKSLPGCG